MKISVVICTYDIDRFSDTLSSINSVLSQTYNDSEVVVVVDRNEELFKLLKKEVKSPKVSIVLSKDAGLSACRNNALNHVKGDIVAFLDDDAVADKDWLRYLSESYDDDGVMCVGGRIEPHPSTPIPEFFPAEMNWILGCTYKGHPTERGEIRNTFGSNISFKKSVFNEIGAFENKFGRVDNKNITAEETELCVRMRVANPVCKIIYEPKAVVYHRIYKPRLSIDYILKRGFGEGYSKAIVSRKFKNKKVLSVESDALKNTVKRSIPQRLKNIMTGRKVLSNSDQLILLVLISGVVLIGFLNGIITGRRSST